MNRIILVGNGFDLAFGLKTTYNDFLFDYFKKAFSNLEIEAYNDGLINVFQHPFNIRTAKSVREFKTVQCFIENSYDNNDREKGMYHLSMKSLMSSLINKEPGYLWVNIERDYYRLLCQQIEFGDKNLKDLNKQFDLLQKKLSVYLNSIQTKFLKEMDSKTDNKRWILAQQLSEVSNITGLKPSNLLFLNFNFTKTLEIIKEPMSKHNINYINYIQLHGELDDTQNEIIFGYGDEEDESYKNLENNDECLRYIKTYRYLHNNNYHRFLNFADQDDYEVYILGHSCGLSDKTMLTELFNNDKCKSIKILPYVKTPSLEDIHSTNYLDIAYSIGRVFTDKVAMRRKVRNFEINDVLSISRNKVPERFI